MNSDYADPLIVLLTRIIAEHDELVVTPPIPRLESQDGA